uniref:Uncharacterized protein n=1 Tax=viral metagenome TaxID=1070528 RepID=A0A6H2A4N2_9ZZZZ
MEENEEETKKRIRRKEKAFREWVEHDAHPLLREHLLRVRDHKGSLDPFLADVRDMMTPEEDAK